MATYPVEVGGILHELGAMIVLEDRVTIGALDTEDTRFRLVDAPFVDAILTNAGDGIVLNGSVTAQIETDCSRCLDPFIFTITSTLEGLYTTEEKASELPEGLEWEPVRHDSVDIVHAVESALRLDLPFAPLHAEDCAGICPACGCNRNEVQCECDSGQNASGPFDSLKDLFETE